MGKMGVVDPSEAFLHQTQRFDGGATRMMLVGGHVDERIDEILWEFGVLRRKFSGRHRPSQNRCFR